MTEFELLTELRDGLRCAVCKRKVSLVRLEHDRLTDRSAYVVTCHGAEEVVEVPNDLLTRGRRTTFGEAFAVKALPPLGSANPQ